MAIKLNDNLNINAPKPVRDTDRVGSGWKYATKEDIPTGLRYVFMTTIDNDGNEWRLIGGIANENWKLDSSTNFNGNRAIKAIPQVGTNYKTSNLADFIEAAFFPFINAIILLENSTEYYEIDSSAVIFFSGEIIANDENTFENARIENADKSIVIALTNEAGNYSDNSLTIDKNNDFTAYVDVGGNGDIHTINSVTKHIRFIYAAYFGKNTTGDVPTATEIKEGTKRIVLTGSYFTNNPNTTDSEFGWFAVPHDQTGKIYTTWYVDALNNAAIGTGEFIEYRDTVDVDGISYDVYMYGYASALTNNLKLS